MSVSKYKWTEACDGKPCVGDCDLCSKDVEADGFITRDEDVQFVPALEYNGRPLTVLQEARPAGECDYPHCETCSRYILHRGERYCTVPMVISKQMWMMRADSEREFKRDITELKELVYDVILGKKSEDECGNYSAGDAV